MMITEKTKAESCFADDEIYLYRFDESFTAEDVMAFKELGRLKYYGDFARPLFCVCLRDGTFFKGVQGARECRVIFPKGATEGDINRFEQRINNLFSTRSGFDGKEIA